METTGSGGGGGGIERHDSQNLRDFLRVKQEDDSNGSGSGRNNLSGMTLNAVLSDKRGQSRDESLERTASNRTLLDIIREESGNGAYKDGKKSWRHFREKLRLRRNGSGSAWTSSVRVPASDVPLNNNSNRNDRKHPTRVTFAQFGDSADATQRPNLERNSSRAMERASGRFEHTSSLAMRRMQRERDNDDDDDDDHHEKKEEHEEGSGSGGEGDHDHDEEEEEEEEAEGGQGEARTSLFALLAESDRQMGLDFGYMLEEEDEDEDEDDELDSGTGEYNNCCVCMVRHKGAAFIPCGHTFCRLCSRELYAQRGNCPLCNNYILEILDIF